MSYWFAFLFIATVAVGAIPSSAENAADRLSMFLGIWNAVGTASEGSGKPLPVHGTTTCRWSSDAHIFLACDGAWFTGTETGPHHQLSVYSYDATSKQYGFININTSFASSPDLTFKGNTWTYLGKYTDKAGVTTYYRTRNIFDEPGLYRYISEESRDNVHWMQTGSGTCRRTAF